MEKKDIAYIILHYNSIEDTLKCVSSLQLITGGKIVIVCNGSTNGSDRKIYETYNEVPGVYVIVNETNLGFARGLNVGYRFAKYELNSKMILCLNNDIIVTQNEFEDILIEEYFQNKFALAGPDVRNPEGECCNPWHMKIPTINDVEEVLKYYKKLYRNSCVLWGLPDLMNSIRNKLFSNKINFEQQMLELKDNPDYIMTFHGSFLIFSEIFISKRDGLFDKTFLYGEEHILGYECYRDDLKVYYCSKLKALHNESASTKKSLTTPIKRHRFFYKHLVDSYEEYLNLLKSDNR